MVAIPQPFVVIVVRVAIAGTLGFNLTHRAISTLLISMMRTLLGLFESQIIKGSVLAIFFFGYIQRKLTRDKGRVV